jgi:hypothetical protein
MTAFREKANVQNNIIIILKILHISIRSIIYFKWDYAVETECNTALFWRQM